MILCAIGFAIGAGFIVHARQKARQNAETFRRYQATLSDNLKRFGGFMQEGAVGEVPIFAPTGNTDIDLFFQATRDYYTAYFEEFKKLDGGLKSLNETVTLDCLALTNKTDLEAEIQKRINARQMYRDFTSNALSVYENYLKKFSALKMSEAGRYGLLKQASDIAPVLKRTYRAWAKTQESSQDLLQFLEDHFGDYTVIDGTVRFSTDENIDHYNKFLEKYKDAWAAVKSNRKRAIHNFNSGLKTINQVEPEQTQD